MQFVTVEDEFGLLECTLFPRAFSAHPVRLDALGPYVVRGIIEIDRRAVNLNVSSIEEFGKWLRLRD